MTNSLAIMRPDLCLEWHPTKNGDLTPEAVAYKSSKKVWWCCPKGHDYEQTVYKRVGMNSACPYCSGKRVLFGYNDLLTINPVLASEWNYTKNDGLLPTQFTLHSNRKVWWKCKICEHEWEAVINHRANGRGCPICAKEKRVKSFRENRYLRRGTNDLATLRPDLCAEWNTEKNGDHLPNDYTCNSKEKMWWTCGICGYEWATTISNRVNRHSGCPRCMKYTRTSFPEQTLFYYIQKVFPNALNSYTEIFSPRKMELDVFIPELRTGIEYDGKAWHKKNGTKEKEKYLICQTQGVRLIRISEVQYDSDTCCDDVIIRTDSSTKSLDEAVRKVLLLLSGVQIDIDSERDRNQIVLQYIKYIKDKSIAAKMPWAVAFWDNDLNDGITADMVNATSNRKYWWHCEKGHIYKAIPANKYTLHAGCPVCSGRQVLSGYNDLQTRYPKIALEWDVIKNAPLSPCCVMPGSQVHYWWICPKGHSYSMSPNSRTASNSGCPICAGKMVLQGYNDLRTTNPDTASKWDYDKNGGLMPDNVMAGSNSSVWWKCTNGHSWKNKIVRQVLYDSCPICTGRLLQKGVNDLTVTHPHLANEWSFEKNQNKMPSDYMRTSPAKVWWRCEKCGGEWQASIRVRATTNCGCPFCSNDKKRETRAYNVKRQGKDLVSLFPEIAKEWDYERYSGRE